jgi:hypothetical protein
MIEAGHKKFEFLILPIKTMNYIDNMFFEQNICPIISGSGNIKGLDIRRRDGNGRGGEALRLAVRLRAV